MNTGPTDLGTLRPPKRRDGTIGRSRRAIEARQRQRRAGPETGYTTNGLQEALKARTGTAEAMLVSGQVIQTAKR